MKKLLLSLLAISLAELAAAAVMTARPGGAAAGSAAAVTRPPILRVAHIGLFVSDMARSRQFYTHVLGFADAFSLDKPTGGLMLTYIKVNDHQYIELFPGLKSPDQDRLSHIAFETTDALRLRDYLASRGVKVPAQVKPGLDGNLSFMVKDPDGHNVEFVQYLRGSLHSRNFGKDLPSTRISQTIIHVGITVRDRAAADKFYKDILGFKDIWEGGMTDTRTDWVDMRVPEGRNWLEYMLNSHNPTPHQLGVMHHFSLGVKNIQIPYKEVLARGYKPPQPPQLGRDGKWQLNLYDPDDTRVEVMEFKLVRPACCSPMHSPY